MSWSLGTSGTPFAVCNTVEQWPAMVAELDRIKGVAEPIAAAHQQQVSRVVEGVNAFAGATPNGFLITVSANGHADGTGLDSWNLNTGAYKAVPVHAAEHR